MPSYTELLSKDIEHKGLMTHTKEVPVGIAYDKSRMPENVWKALELCSQ